MTPRPENHADLHRRPERDLRHATSLYALCAFGDRAGSRFRSSLHRACLRRDASGLRPCALRSSTELTTSSRCAVLRRPIAPSWEATWAEACEQLPVGSAKVPCAPTPQGSGTPRDPLLAEAPSTLCRRPGCVNSWRAVHALAVTPWPTEASVRAAPREGGDVPRDQSAWIRSVRTVPVKGCPFWPVVRPSRDAAPRGTLPS